MPSRSSRELLKRRREGYQLSVHQYAELKRHRRSRTEVCSTEDNNHVFSHHDGHADLVQSPHFLEAAVTDQGGAAKPTSTLGSACVYHKSDNFSSLCASQTCNEERRHNYHAKSGNAAHELALHLRPVRINVVRGDTGRRGSFFLQTTFLYTWHHGNHFYHSLDGEQVGLELQERVLCQVASVSTALPEPHEQQVPLLGLMPVTSSGPLGNTRTATATTTALLSNASTHNVLNSEHHRRTFTHNEEAAVCAPTATITGTTLAPHIFPTHFTPNYSYEAMQVSRCLSPPTHPHTQTSDPCAHLGICSPALFVDCLLKCVHDEAVLPDDHGWVYLYQGRHILTGVGQTRLLHDLFAHGYLVSEGSSPPTLTVCVFRKC